MATLGEILRERRQEKRWTLQDVAQRTRIRAEYLEALEEGRYEALPADVYVRGFLRNYSLLLGLSPDDILAMYRQERGAPRLVSIAPISRPPRTRSFVLPSLGFALFATLATAVCGWWVISGLIYPTAVPPTATLPPPTPTAILPTATPTVRVLLHTPTPSATVEPTPTSRAGVTAVLEFSAPCWVRVVADGVQIFEGTLGRGVTRTFTATGELQVRLGNAGGVRATVNGQDLGVQGNSGQVVTRVWKANP